MKVGLFDVCIILKTEEGETETLNYKDTPLSKVGNLQLPTGWTIQSVSAKRIPQQ